MVARSSSVEGDELEVEYTDSFRTVLDSGADLVVVDMPIGLSADGRRPADVDARARLGTRRSTFFPTPVRCVLDYASHADANDASRRASGRGLSIQAWNLVPKIREIDDVWTESLTDRLFEGHPETTFAEMTGAPLQDTKSTFAGRAARVAALRDHVADSIEETLITSLPAKFHGDAVDAAALIWTARRLAAKTALILGGEPDPAGRPMRLAI